MDDVTLVALDPEKDKPIVDFCRHELVAIPSYLIAAANKEAQAINIPDLSANDVLVTWLRRGMIESQKQPNSAFGPLLPLALHCDHQGSDEYYCFECARGRAI